MEEDPSPVQLSLRLGGRIAVEQKMSFEYDRKVLWKKKLSK